MTTKAIAQAILDAASFLDVQSRAWVVGVGRLVGNEGDDVPDGALIRRMLEEAYDSEEFPAGQLAYVPDREPVRVNPEFHMVTVSHATEDGEPFLELKIGFGIAGYVAVGFTRSGRMGDEQVEPSHVLLADVEAIIIDVAHLLTLLAEHRDYAGDCQVIVSVASEVPDRPVRLRAYDETIGELIPADRCPESFTPLIGTFRTPVDRSAFHRYGWELAKQAAAQFEVSGPQLFVDPAKGTPPVGGFGYVRGEPTEEEMAGRRPSFQVSPDPL